MIQLLINFYKALVINIVNILNPTIYCVVIISLIFSVFGNESPNVAVDNIDIVKYTKCPYIFNIFVSFSSIPSRLNIRWSLIYAVK